MYFAFMISERIYVLYDELTSSNPALVIWIVNISGNFSGGVCTRTIHLLLNSQWYTPLPSPYSASHSYRESKKSIIRYSMTN